MSLADRVHLTLTIMSALGTGLISGVFFIFSVAIMRALERTPGGMAAMQSINVVIINPIFLGLFMGTALVCLVLAVSSAVRWEQPGAMWILAGSLLYLIGAVGITIVFNVPMNNSLVAADPSSVAGQEIWKNYLTNWTFWNHVRTVTSLAASASFIAALAAR
jgi:uncharacterized membrane protein